MTEARVSRLSVEVLQTDPDPDLRLSRLSVEALQSTTELVPAVPDAPTNPSAVAVSSSQINVSWDNVADETGYRVERSPDGSSGWTDVSGNLAADTTSYSDTGLSASTQYFYRVIAFNANGDSDPSTTVNATTEAGGDTQVMRSPRYGITRSATR